MSGARSLMEEESAPEQGDARLPDNDSPLGAANDHSPPRLPRGPGVMMGAWQDCTPREGFVKVRVNQGDLDGWLALERGLGTFDRAATIRAAWVLAMDYLVRDPQGAIALLEASGARWDPRGRAG